MFSDIPPGPIRDLVRQSGAHVHNITSNGPPVEVVMDDGCRAYLSESGHAQVYFESDPAGQRYAMLRAIANRRRKEGKIKPELDAHHYLKLSERGLVAYVTEPTAESFLAALNSLREQRLANG